MLLKIFLTTINNKNNILEKLIYFQFILLAFILFFTKGLSAADFSLGGDTPSYLAFSFSSFSEALSSHRTFGLPLILNIYNTIFNSLFFWPTFQLVIYCSSVLFFFFFLIQSKFNILSSFVISCGLIWNPSVGGAFKHAETEIFTAVFLILIFSTLLRVVSSKNNKLIPVLAFLIFYLYQIRPNMAFVVFIIPIWGFMISKFIYSEKTKYAFNFSFKLFYISIIPLLIFCATRYFVVGDFGMASFSGTVISGHATSYLDEKNLLELDGKSRDLANGILSRKKKLSSPCSKIKDLSFEEQQYCGNTHIMISWLSAIKQLNGVEPFEESEKNIEPWKYKNLSNFFSVNNVQIDKLLKNYSLKILKIEKDLYFKATFKKYKEAFKSYFRMLFDHYIYLIATVLIIISFGANKYLYAFKKIEIEKDIIVNQNKEFLVMIIISLTLMISGVVSTGMLIHFDPRYLESFSLFYLSSLLVYSLPIPFKLKK